MAALKMLAVSAATGRIGYVFFSGRVLVDYGLSRKGYKSNNNAACVLQRWIASTQPDIVITEQLSKSSKKGERARAIIRTFAFIASHNYVHDIEVPLDREGRTRFQQAKHLSDLYPDIAPRLPSMNKCYQSEDRAMILFDALTLAHKILENPSIRIAAAMDPSLNE